jgi:hypothetical protein
MEIRELLHESCMFGDAFCLFSDAFRVLANLSDTQASLKLSNHPSFPMPM